MKRCWSSRFLWMFFWPFSLLYRLAMFFRNVCYNIGIFETTRPDARIVSVGNITVGGTGKTPLVAYVAEKLGDQGRRVAVLSRGYGRKTKGVVVVSDGKEIFTAPESSGDEPFLLAKRLQGVPVIVGESRVDAGKEAIDRFGCDAFVLDDAFQHRRMCRDVNLVVMDAGRPWGNGQLLPAGPLRESLSSLKRASAIVLKHTPGMEPDEKNLHRIRRITQAPFIFMRHEPTGWVSLKDNEAYPPAFLKGKQVLAFSGIGTPSSFRKTLESTGVHIDAFRAFGDHHWYGKRDVQRIQRIADDLGVDAVVTTEKDAVRWAEMQAWGGAVYYLKIEVAITSGKKVLDRLLRFTDASWEDEV